MSPLNFFGLRAPRSSADVQQLASKLGRAIVSFSNAKIEFAPTRTSKNGHTPTAPTVTVTTAPPPAAPKPEGPGAALAAAAAALAAAAPPPKAAPSPAPAPAAPAPEPEPATSLGLVTRRPSALFTPPPGPDEEHVPAVPARQSARGGKVVYREQEASGARLQEARRLNRIAIFGVSIGLLNFIGLIAAAVFVASILHSMTATMAAAQSTTKIDQRAWVGLGTTRLVQPYSRSSIGMTVSLNNTGKTPANIDGIDVKITAVDARTNLRTTIASKHFGARSIGPNGYDTLTILEAKPLTAAAFGALLNRSVRHEFAIGIQYHDAFGDQHSTEVCKAVESSGSAMAYGDAFSTCSPNTMN